MSRKNRNSILFSKIVPTNELPPIVKFLIANKVVRTANEAKVLLLFIAAGCLASALTIWGLNDYGDSYTSYSYPVYGEIGTY
ncbi:MAG: hypothetical protein Q8P52_00085 [bacterium]|nr:hypothetical protein [bacterium]